MPKTTQSVTDAEKRQKWISFVQSLSPNIDPHAMHLVNEMRMVSHAMYQIGESSLAMAGLSYAQYRILMGLYFAEKMENRGELNPSEISDRQGTSRNTISALIRSLEEEGLVERHLDQSDRRKFNICLTDAGRQKVSDHATRHMDVVGGCFGALSTAEQETMSHLLAKLSQHISAARESMMVGANK
jgi:DNA-binding MarR family transcriptional regulator